VGDTLMTVRALKHVDDEKFMTTLRFDEMGIQSTSTSYRGSLEYKCRSSERYSVYIFCQPLVLD